MFTKALTLLAASILVALLIIACGDDPAPTVAPTDPPAPTAASVPATEPPAQASTSDEPTEPPAQASTSAQPTEPPAPTATSVPPTDTPEPEAPAAYTSVTVESCTAVRDEEGEVHTGAAAYTYTEPPSRAITMNQHVTEVMLALELQEHMVGTAYIDDEILPQYMEAYDSVPVLSDQYPAKEVILAQNPDFIYGGFRSAFGDTAAGSQEELNDLGIGTYLTSSICNTDSADTIDDVYADILNVGMIFGVSDRAEALVADLKHDVADAASQAAGSGDPLRVFLFDSGDDAPFTATCCSMFTNMIETAGGKNIFDDVEGRWKTVNWEEVIDRDPELIVLTEADWSTSQEKLDLLMGNSALADITAVKEQRFVILKFSSLVPGIRNATAIAELAEAVGQ